MPFHLDLLAVALALQQTAVVANPLPNAKFDISERIYVPPCILSEPSPYSITKSDPHATGKGIVGDLYCNGNNQGCSLSQEQSFSETVTIDVGFDLDLGEIFSVLSGDLSAGVSISRETATASTAGKECPTGPWTCALVFSPNVLHVEGTKAETISNTCGSTQKGPESPYSVDFPKANSDGVYGGGVDVCVCTEFDHWADNGAPSLACPGPCTAH